MELGWRDFVGPDMSMNNTKKTMHREIEEHTLQETIMFQFPLFLQKTQFMPEVGRKVRVKWFVKLVYEKIVIVRF